MIVEKKSDNRQPYVRNRYHCGSGLAPIMATGHWSSQTPLPSSNHHQVGNQTVHNVHRGRRRDDIRIARDSKRSASVLWPGIQQYHTCKLGNLHHLRMVTPTTKRFTTIRNTEKLFTVANDRWSNIDRMRQVVSGARPKEPWDQKENCFPTEKKINTMNHCCYYVPPINRDQPQAIKRRAYVQPNNSSDNSQK